MQSIILAAGMGRRLGELTRNNTKCMIEVNHVALIDRLLEQLSKLNLSRVLIVVGYKGENLIRHIGHRYDDKIKIEYATNPVFDKTNNIYSLSLVKEQLQEEDTLLIESDLIVEDSLFRMIIDNPHPNLALVAKYETWMDGTMVCIDNDNNIVNFVTRSAFNYAEVSSYYKTVNIYKFSKEFSRQRYVPFLDAYCKAIGNNEYYEQVLRVITLLDKTDMKALPIGNAKWYEIDDIQDLDIAETLFSSEENRLPKYFKRYGGYWRFEKLIDFCYLVNPYFPPQRMFDEIQANLPKLITGYPSGMYVNSLLGGKYFSIRQDYTVVGNGAAELIKSLMSLTDGKIGVVYPTFEEYPNRKKMENIVPFVPNNANWSYTESDLENFYEDKDISTLLLLNPDNPSGNFIPMERCLSLIAWCKAKNIRLIIDESFVDFTEGFENNSLLHDKILEAYSNLIVVKSISKSYGVPGLRLGIMASSNEELINEIKKDVAIWNINSIAEFYMQIYNKYDATYKYACRKFQVERANFYEKLKAIPYLRIIPSQANFFLCEVVDKYTSSELTKLLMLQFNILIKDCKNKNALKEKNYIRIAIRNEYDNDILIDALKQL